MAEKQTRKQATTIKHWSFQEDLQYYFALILLYKVFNSNKRQTKAYKLMTMFVDKDVNKCRTHHEKKLKFLAKDFGNSQLLERNLYKFYYQNYKLRKLNESHLRLELQCFMQKLLTDEVKIKQFQQCKEYFEDIDQKLNALQLEKYCLTYNKVEVECQTTISDFDQGQMPESKSEPYFRLSQN